jgi:hypothetical protein
MKLKHSSGGYKKEKPLNKTNPLQNTPHDDQGVRMKLKPLKGGYKKQKPRVKTTPFKTPMIKGYQSERGYSRGGWVGGYKKEKQGSKQTPSKHTLMIKGGPE